MSTHAHEKINYLEFPSLDLEATKQFFTAALGWSFVDYGPDYSAFSGQGLDGGFCRASKVARPQDGSALVAFYSAQLEATLHKLVAAGAVIAQEIFDFPGGRRFHFVEPGGNEFAVWSEPVG